MTKEKILIVEDDKHISKLVRYNLEKANYECSIALTGEEALAIVHREPFDLIILDVMLPKIDGLDVCRQIKQEERSKNIPIVMLTAKGEEVDKIVGLELGVDDYIVKPFSPRELILRIKAILRRRIKEEIKKDILRAGTLTVDIPSHKVTVNQKIIELTAMEFKLLVTLMERRGRVQTRDRLLNDVWDISKDVYTRTIDTHVKRLREKLCKAGVLIETVVGMGYRFKQIDDEN